MNAGANPAISLLGNLTGGFSAASLILGILFSTIGVAYFRYGKKQGRTSVLMAGIGLSIYPWFVYSPWLLTLIGVVLMAVPLVF